jgi:hypothetical protein
MSDEKNESILLQPCTEEFVRMIKKKNEPLTVRLENDPHIYNLKARYGYFRPHHKQIAEKLSLFCDNYKQFIQGLGSLADFFAEIPMEQPSNPEQAAAPYWSNDYLPTGDAIALCGFLFTHNPLIYLEIGSGNSTKFARRVISHFNLRTKIISVDPSPRSEIDAICDKVIRAPIEIVPQSVFDSFQGNNILFIDSSHRCLQNSDVTLIFLDILPNLNPGVIVHFHDICWPDDYPDEWVARVYNEQYLLGVLFLFGAGYEILYSSKYVSSDSDLRSEFEAVLRRSLPDRCGCEGSSLWMKLTG